MSVKSAGGDLGSSNEAVKAAEALKREAEERREVIDAEDADDEMSAEAMPRRRKISERNSEGVRADVRQDDAPVAAPSCQSIATAGGNRAVELLISLCEGVRKYNAPAPAAVTASQSSSGTGVISGEAGVSNSSATIPPPNGDNRRSLVVVVEGRRLSELNGAFEIRANRRDVLPRYRKKGRWRGKNSK
ncbi:hypothetical protein ACHAW5_000617 [Stephanodiscus triporus]|uniref:Uncharacterized protein n=1 Tax=Stephanodiscus triporus TaxID=2934178 RepID=A0ABD3NY09_9STRA